MKLFSSTPLSSLFFILFVLFGLVSCGGGSSDSNDSSDEGATSKSSFFTLPNQSLNDKMISIIPAADGSGNIYVGGSFTNDSGTTSNRIARFNSDGTLDGSFAVGSGFSSVVSSIVPAADGSGDIYVAGDFTSYNGTDSNRIIRLNGNGTVDSGFSVGTGFDNTVTTIAPATDGSGDIFVGGYFTRYNGTESNRIIRLNGDGTVDSSFAVGAGFDIIVLSIVPSDDSSGDIYVGGAFTSYNGAGSNRIIRLNSNGTVDSGFAVGSGFDASVLTMALAADGSGDIYLGGTFSSYNGTDSNHIIRLNSDGTVDSGFAIGSGFNDLVQVILPTTDGSGGIYVGGDFTRCNATDSNRIVRLNIDGTVDTGFVTGAGFNGRVQTITSASDSSGNIYLGGQFTAYQNAEALRNISLNTAGAIN